MNVRRVLPRDAIPSVDDPAFGEGYDGDPVAVTWCPLCGSTVVYDRRHRGHTLEFGVSGKLAAADLVMYDRETDSEWKQSSGECIAGRFAGDSLSVRPGAMLSWREFRESFPDGVVLQPPGGRSEAASGDDDPAPIDYDASPYGEYFDSEGFDLAAHRGTDDGREWTRDDDLRPKTAVLGVETDGTVLGFPLPRVLDAGEIHGFADPGPRFDRTEAGLVADGTAWDPVNGRAVDGRRSTGCRPGGCSRSPGRTTTATTRSATPPDGGPYFDGGNQVTRLYGNTFQYSSVIE